MSLEKRLKVTTVNADGNAEKIGLKAGDILEEMDGISLNTARALDDAIARNTIGATLVFYRDGDRKSIAVPPGRMGIVVVEIDFDPTQYFAERDLYRRVGEMLMTTTPSIDGYRVTRTIEIVTSECVFGLNVFKDFFMGLTDFFGGRSGTAQTALRDARRVCLQELKKEAALLGANAVIGVDLDYSEFSGKGTAMLFLVASGTAVFIEKIEDKCNQKGEA